MNWYFVLISAVYNLTAGNHPDTCGSRKACYLYANIDMQFRVKSYMLFRSSYWPCTSTWLCVPSDAIRENLTPWNERFRISLVWCSLALWKVTIQKQETHLACIILLERYPNMWYSQLPSLALCLLVLNRYTDSLCMFCAFVSFCTLIFLSYFHQLLWLPTVYDEWLWGNILCSVAGILHLGQSSIMKMHITLPFPPSSPLLSFWPKWSWALSLFHISIFQRIIVSAEYVEEDILAWEFVFLIPKPTIKMLITLNTGYPIISPIQRDLVSMQGGLVLGR